MTAASVYPPSSPDPKEGRAAEPSMEDILASIRRIIADDQVQTGRVPPSEGQRAVGAAAPRAYPAEQAPTLGADVGSTPGAVARTRTPYDDVLDLARLPPAAGLNVAEPAPEPRAASAGQASRATPDQARAPQRDLTDPSEATPAASRLRSRMPEPTPREVPRESEPSVPDDGATHEDDLLSPPLAASVMSAFEALAATVVLQNMPMLERVMRDLLRPLIKTWLDDHLPAMVERLVRAEIERVARGQRG